MTGILKPVRDSKVSILDIRWPTKGRAHQSDLTSLYYQPIYLRSCGTKALLSG